MPVVMIRTQVPTSTGQFNVDTTKLGGATPKMTRHHIVHSTTNSVYEAHGAVGIGMTDGSNQWSFSVGSKDDEGSTSVKQRSESTSCAFLLNPQSNNSIDFRATFVNFHANGISLNATNVDAAYYMITTFWFGDDVTNAYVNTESPNGTINSYKTITSVGFEASQLILTGVMGTINSWSASQGALSDGVVVNGDTAITQGSTSMFLEDNADPSAVNGMMSETYGLSYSSHDGTKEYAVEFNNFTSSGFRATTRSKSGNANESFGYAAVKYLDKTVFCGPMDSPNSTGETPWLVTDSVEFVNLYITNAATYDTVYEDGSVGRSHSIGYGDTEDEFCSSMVNEDLSDRTVTKSMSIDTIVKHALHTVVVLFVGSLSGMYIGSFVINFSASSTVIKKWYMWGLSGPGGSDRVIGRGIYRGIGRGIG